MFGRIVRAFLSPEVESFRRELNELRSTVEQLELTRSEQQLTVLAACEKTLRAIDARERMRVNREADIQPGEEEQEQVPRRQRVVGTAHLARRFR